ncbi:hypothetical protein F0562_015241 [Nyssa sinensis]|uniref:Uncharacterized protein n=1 Tax=Nyssa sinensis TaxID=561372 RepID=A0A5J4ZIW0_9ASTE|nr:hypothetical protein F0562_015241 [Nyssa sinensis]
MGNEENFRTDRVANENKASSDCEKDSDDDSCYVENIEISDDDDIVDYCEDKDLELNEEGAVGQQNRQRDCGEDEGPGLAVTGNGILLVSLANIQ